MRLTIKIAFLALLSVLFLSGCAKEALEPAGDVSLKNTYWKAVEIKGEKALVADNQQETHIVLQEDGRIVGSDGCNRMFGTYAIKNETITFSHLASTRMMCAEGMKQADNFSVALGETSHFTLWGEALTFENERGEVLLRFMAVYF
ncbi:META domain-containing protein [Sulfurospirillum sp. T05]|uniref:META domain-containing protein n=1 Tax=Sulfurospirillum tamanense TaxID=2813362 RepID=A0ABS2WVF7_9BACT|nr:META domain-containing protein [Sulfurospirillum tamanensis]MBN2965600.1 META domain-containing protein [Sulfurospirillum tamanensis]